MLHASIISTLMDQTDEKGKPKRVNLKFYKQSTGEKVDANDVILTSYYHRNGTLNIKWPNGDVRKIRLALITEFNGKEVYL
jgi:hypothetical protein